MIYVHRIGKCYDRWGLTYLAIMAQRGHTCLIGRFRTTCLEFKNDPTITHKIKKLVGILFVNVIFCL